MRPHLETINMTSVSWGNCIFSSQSLLSFLTYVSHIHTYLRWSTFSKYIGLTKRAPIMNENISSNSSFFTSLLLYFFTFFFPYKVFNESKTGLQMLTPAFLLLRLLHLISPPPSVNGWKNSIENGMCIALCAIPFNCGACYTYFYFSVFFTSYQLHISNSQTFTSYQLHTCNSQTFTSYQLHTSTSQNFFTS